MQRRKPYAFAWASASGPRSYSLAIAAPGPPAGLGVELRAHAFAAPGTPVGLRTPAASDTLAGMDRRVALGVRSFEATPVPVWREEPVLGFRPQRESTCEQPRRETTVIF